jgi:hypothetical protein
VEFSAFVHRIEVLGFIEGKPWLDRDFYKVIDGFIVLLGFLGLDGAGQNHFFDFTALGALGSNDIGPVELTAANATALCAVGIMTDRITPAFAVTHDC